MQQYIISRIQLLSALKFGTVIGTLLTLLPAFLLALVARGLIGILRRWLESWSHLTVGSLVDIDLLEISHLSAFLKTLQSLDAQGGLLVLALTLGIVVAGGVLVGLGMLLGAAGYNAVAAVSGGFVVSALPLHRAEQPVATLPPSAGRSMGQGAGGVWLVSRQPPLQRWPLRAAVTTLGSAPDNDVVLGDLAPHHAEIRLDNQRYILYDLGSNQSWVNGRLLNGPNLLKSGFELRLGPHSFIFQGEP